MIFKHEWRSNVKMLLLWAICIAGFDFAMMLMYPSLQDSMQEMASAYQNFGIFTAAFSLDRMDLGTVMGFYGMYIGTILSLGGTIFAAIIGISILAKEESGHTSEYLFTLPYSRRNIVAQKVAAVFSMLVVFQIVNFLLGILSIQIIGEEILLKKIVLFHCTQLLLELEVASIGILISACTKKVLMGAGLGIVLLLYFMDMMSRVLEQLEFCKYITPFYYANATELFTGGNIDGLLVIIGVIVTIVCVVAGTYLFRRKDLAA